MKFTFGIITKSENNFGNNDPSSADKSNIIKAIESINNLKLITFVFIFGLFFACIVESTGTVS